MSPTLVNTDFLHYQSQSLQLQTTLTMENKLYVQKIGVNSRKNYADQNHNCISIETQLKNIAWNVETHALLSNNQELNWGRSRRISYPAPMAHTTVD